MNTRSILLGIAIAGIVLALSNPSEEAYANYVIRSWRKQVCQQRSLPTPEALACTTSTILPLKLSAEVVQNFSYRQNYVFFTIYDLSLGNTQRRIIGVAGQFFST